MSASHLVAGVRAEDLAVRHLEDQGYRVVVRNHRCPAGEVDVIAWDGDVLCFVEVRSRDSDAQYDPLESITPLKQRRIIAAARHFLTSLAAPWPEMRFDAVGVVLAEPPRLTLVREAFDASS